MLTVGSLIVSLDDDKKKASIGKGKNMQGLKQHVLSDRRKGIVGHTAVSPATLLTLGVCWEKEGLSSYDCYVELVEEIFGVKPNLDKVTFASDRGYWILKVLKYLLAHGADVHGTVRRQDWLDLTYDTALKDGDTRMNINKNGPATLYTATTNIAGRDITSCGYRTGTGSVALTISSLIHGAQWECVTKESMRVVNKIPPVVHPDRRRGLLFRPFGSNESVDDHVISLLGELEIEHVTEFQGFLEWHWARKFSITSKGVAMQVPIQMRLDKEQDERSEHWTILDQYLSTDCGVGNSSIGESESTESESSRDRPEESVDDGEGTDEETEAEDDEAAVVSVETQEVEGMLKDATDTTERNETYRQTLIDELKDGKYKDRIAEMVKQMGGKPAKSYDTNRKKALLWLEAKPEERPFVFLTVAELKVRSLADM